MYLTEPGVLQSIGFQGIGYDWSDLAQYIYLTKYFHMKY